MDKCSRNNKKVRFAEDIAGDYISRIGYLKYEVFFCVYLDVKNRIICEKEITRGTPSYARPIIRNVIEEAIRAYATTLICVHNHPSGDVYPSEDDIQFTGKLIKSVEYLDLRLLDHIIVSEKDFMSMRRGNRNIFKINVDK